MLKIKMWINDIFFSSDGLPSLVQDFGPYERSAPVGQPLTIKQRAVSTNDLPLGEGCALVCQVLPNTQSTETVC